MAYERSFAAVTLAGGLLRRPARARVDSAAGGSSSTAQCNFSLKVCWFEAEDTLGLKSNEGCHGPSSPSRALEDVSGSPASIFTSRAERLERLGRAWHSGRVRLSSIETAAALC